MAYKFAEGVCQFLSENLGSPIVLEIKTQPLCFIWRLKKNFLIHTNDSCVSISCPVYLYLGAEKSAAFSIEERGYIYYSLA